MRRPKFIVAAVLVGLLVPVATLLALDLYAHHRFERVVLVNVWGYRGPVVKRKQPGEYRVAVFGGSAAFGFGVRWEESMPRLLERKLSQRRPGISVVNLAYNGEGVYSFPYTMDDYAFLKYDMVLMYESYNDLLGDPARADAQVVRRESPIFRVTGYMPIFPLVAREKASVMLHGDTRDVYAQAHRTTTVFSPGLATRTTAEILRSAAAIGESLEVQFGRTMAAAPLPAAQAAGDRSGCTGQWALYCRMVFTAIMKARAERKDALVATPPYLLGDKIRPGHQAQQLEMANMIARNFGRDARVRYVNLGNLVDVGDPEMSFDRMHLTMAGNERIADALVDPVLQMSASASH